MSLLIWCSFRYGPVAGKSLTLARAPVYLRVVIDPAGQVDALDQLGDVAAGNETIFAYRINPDSRGTLHIDRTDPRTRRRVGEWFHTVTYGVVPDPPPDTVLRDTQSWRAWCQERAAEGKHDAE